MAMSQDGAFTVCGPGKQKPGQADSIGAERVSLSLAEFIKRPQSDDQIGAMTKLNPSRKAGQMRE